MPLALSLHRIKDMLTPVTSRKDKAVMDCCRQQQQSQISAFVLPFMHAAAMYTALSAVCLKQHVQHCTHELLCNDVAGVLYNRGIRQAGHVLHRYHRAMMQTQHELCVDSSKHVMEVRAVERIDSNATPVATHSLALHNKYFKSFKASKETVYLSRVATRANTKRQYD